MEEVGPENKGGDCLVRMSKVRKMIEQARKESKNKRDSRVTKMVEKTTTDVLKMCAAATQKGAV